MKSIKILSVTISILLLCSCGQNSLCENTFFAMDTVMDIKIYGDKNIMSEISSCISDADRAFDRNNSDSEIFKLNISKNLEISPETAALIQKAVAVSEDTDGAFDITIAPVMDLWGFYNQQYHVPDTVSLNSALACVSYKNIFFSGNTVSLSGGASLDLGGIAKGYLSDKLCDIIKSHNISSAIMSLGGNVYCVGSKPNGSKWTIGIRSPKNNAELLCSVNVSDCAVVTSGTYERYFERDGQRYHHIIDPKTGLPVDNNLASVTVICKDGTRADALSTALFVMGIDKAFEFQKKSHDFEAVFIKNDNSIYITPGIEHDFSADSYKILN